MKINYKNNQSLKFLLPLVANISPNMLITENLIGAFIGDVNRPEWDGKILVAYYLPNESSFAKLDASICRLPNYRTSYDHVDKRIVVYVLDMPELFIESLEYIMDGNYSLIHPVAKLDISKFWFNISESNIVKDILSDDPTKIKVLWDEWGKDREQYCAEDEYWFKPLLEEELFDIDEL